MNRRIETSFLETRAYLEAMRTNFDVARELVQRAIAVAVDAGLEVLLDTHTRPAAGFVELLAGDPVAAEEELRVACENTEQVGELGFLSSITPMLIDAVYAQGRYEEALALTDRWHVDRLTVPEDVDAQAGWRRARARALARVGVFDEAERLAREADAILSRTDYVNAHADAVAGLGEVLLQAGRGPEAADAAREAIRLYELKGNLASAASSGHDWPSRRSTPCSSCCARARVVSTPLGCTRGEAGRDRGRRRRNRRLQRAGAAPPRRAGDAARARPRARRRLLGR
jgi:tetratricopeptide (TPR) repeat protein